MKYLIILFAIVTMCGCKTLETVIDRVSENKNKAEQPVDNSVYEWSKGGFNGSNAQELPEVVIADLNISDNGMSYRWVSGGCESLGAPDRENPDYTIACFFVSNDGINYVGGKFDWISTSRTSRDFKNIKGNYHGWTEKDLSAKYYAFCIVSKNGRYRTNIIKVQK